MKAFHLPTLLALICFYQLPAVMAADEISLKDSTIVLGERVGPIKKGMNLAGLQALFGKEKVKLVKLPGPEGSEFDGVSLFTGTDRELGIYLNEDSKEKEILDIRVLGKGWVFDNGLKLGMSLAEVEKINGKPFQLGGFDWDYGGTSSFMEGKLEGKVVITFEHGDEPLDESLIGDRQISSDDKKLRGVKSVKVGQIMVPMQ